MSIDSWKTTEPDREPAPGEHRPYDEACDCDECARERAPDLAVKAFRAELAEQLEHQMFVEFESNCVGLDRYRDLGYRAGHNDRARSLIKFLRGEV